MALVVRNLPANPGDNRNIVPSLGQKDPLKKGMATHSSILAWRIPWTEELGRLQSIWLQRLGHDRSDLAHRHTFKIRYKYPNLEIPFLLCFLLLFFSQLFVRPPQTTILPFCISFPWGWSWSLSSVKAVYCHPAYLTYMQSTSCETLGWKKHKLESRLPGEISITSAMQMTPPLWQKVNRN